MREAIERLDALMNRLIEADQTAEGIEPLEIAAELGRIRQLIADIEPRDAEGRAG